METLIEENFKIVADYKIFITSFFILLVILESFQLYREKKLQASENFTNLKVFFIGSIIQNFVFKKMQYLILMFFVPFSFFDLGISWEVFALAFIATDFTYYWKHRFEHINRFYWAEHSVHHSSKVFNLTSALRLPWFAPLFSWPFFLPLVLIGFHPALILSSLLLNLFYQYFIHTEKVKKLGFLEYIFNTPSLHRVHHAQNFEYWDKNFGGVFIFWDILFRTYQPERADLKIFYGVKEYQHLKDPVTINVMPYIDFFKTVQWPTKLSVILLVLSIFGFTQPTKATYQCKEEIQKYCANLPSASELNSCIEKNKTKLSTQCQEIVDTSKSEMFDLFLACRSDKNKYCADQKFGSGQIIECLEKHSQKLTDKCRKKMSQIKL
jgi:sterol desaturase/sphingolipid hydroxylase (fatty acid hydroxylase superfamily)